MADEKILWDAEFNEKVTTYWLLSGALVLTITVFGIVLVPIWFLIGIPLTRRYLKTYRCTLTNRSLKVARGLFVRMEKTVPLDRITDLGLVQGPIMRFFGIEALSIETAGQSSQGALVSLAGIKQGRKFRDAVLKQRDLVVGSQEDRAPSVASDAGLTGTPAGKDEQLLNEIHQTLLRIERQLAKPGA